MKIKMKAEITDEYGNVITKEIEAEVPDVTEFGNPEEFYEIFDRFEKPVIEARNQLGEKKSQKHILKKLSELLKKGRTGDCEIEGEIGRITVNSGNAIVPEHQPKRKNHDESNALDFSEVLYHAELSAGGGNTEPFAAPERKR